MAFSVTAYFDAKPQRPEKLAPNDAAIAESVRGVINATIAACPSDRVEALPRMAASRNQI